jgi:hypothetical protein
MNRQAALGVATMLCIQCFAHTPASPKMTKSDTASNRGNERDISNEELLRLAEPVVTQGFVPPVLARVLYAAGSERTSPWSASIADSKDDSGQDGNAPATGMGRKERKQPVLTSQRRASGPRSGHSSEEVYTETQFYGDASACSDVVTTIAQAGLGALFPDKTDPLLAHGRQALEMTNSTHASPEMGGWEHACGVAYISAPRSSVLLSSSYISTPSLPFTRSSPSPPSSSSSSMHSWWTNVSLSEGARIHLRAIAELLKERKNEQAQGSALEFFRCCRARSKFQPERTPF